MATLLLRRLFLSRVLLPALALCLLTAHGHADPYRVTWESPSKDSSGSMPLGNGEIGVNAWVEGDGDLRFYISKTDAWSGNARLLKVGRIRVSLAPNPFGSGQPFKQTLDVRRGLIEIEAGAEGRRVGLRLWVDANYPVIRLEVDSEQPCNMTVQLDPWRTAPRELTERERFSAYGLMESPAPVVVEADTVVGGEEDRLLWFHRNDKSLWAEGLRLQHMGHWIATAPDPLMARSFGGLVQGDGLVTAPDNGLRSSAPRERHQAAVYVLTAQTPEAGDWLNQIKALAGADVRDTASARAAHEEWWRAFWERSWIRLSPTEGASKKVAAETETISRGYALQRFISACAGRGNFPIKFNGSLFTVDAREKEDQFDADYRRWGGPYWFQNTRLVYWPMLASGDTEMMAPLFRMFSEALPFARDRTRAYFNHGGAFFPETMYFWGAYAMDNYGWEREDDMPDGVTVNRYIRYHYDGALELLSLMLEYYAYTQDRAFLAETLFPMAEAIPAFFYEHYPPQENGKMRFEPSQALETWQMAIDPLPPIAGLKRVLHDLLALPEDLSTEAQRSRWNTIAKALPPLPTEEVKGEKVLVPAAKILEEARNSETPELYAIFPYRLYGVGKKDLDVAIRTFARRKVRGNTGWRQDDMQAAVLGLTEEARARLSDRMARKHPGSRFSAFWGPNFDWIPDQDHGGNALMTLQCMLLQAEGRELHLLPAWPEDWNVDFKLHAPYKTSIEGSYVDRELKILKVTPESRRGDIVVHTP
jgi:alpha-L-fucosidase 2